MHKDINIWHLLTHTSGLPADPGYFTEPYGRDVFRDLGKKDWIKRFLTGPVQSLPGEQWSYSSPCFCILAEIVSRVSGKHFYDYTREEIFKPLGMTRSFFDLPEELVPETSLLGDWTLEMIEHGRDRSPKSCPGGGGGAYSTMEDLFRIGQCYLNGGIYNGHRLLGRTTCEAMVRDQLEGRGVFAYHWGKKIRNFRQGLCWEYFIDGPITHPAVFMHEGWGWCSLFIDPVNEFIYISMYGDDKDWDPDVMVKSRTIAFSGIE
jgi:CubicO group peptidase (beta-lactamase class C family)